MPSPSLLTAGRLGKRELIVVTGKGGVGKSTIAAAVGLALSAAGRRVLLLEIDPRESLCHLLGVPPSDGEIVPVVDRLALQNVRPRDVVDAIVREQVGIEMISRRVLASAVYRHFAEGAPGLTEMAVLSHAWRSVHGDATDALPIDAVVLDAPATGHGLALLAAPRLVSEVIQDGPLARMGGELAGWVADSTRTASLLVTAAEEMPVQEALETLDAMRRDLDTRPAAVVVNGIYPPLDDGVASGSPSPDEAVELWRKRRAVNDRELSRLSTAWNGPLVTLPLLPFDRGPELAAALADLLTRGGGAT